MKISEILVARSEGPNSTDKNRNRKWGHYYGPAYDYIFRSFDREDKLDLIEIGTEWGASLLAWRDYFPNANITGVDIRDIVPEKKEGINYIVSDVKNLKPDKPFDIIIDDGSHKLSDVVYVVENFKLKVGGVMIIEDCRAPEHWFQKIRTLTKYGIECIDFREINDQHDDFLIVLRNYGYYDNN